MFAFAMRLPNEDEIRCRAAREILATSTIPDAIKDRIGVESWGRGDGKCFVPILGEGDFDWPWFDRWLCRFAELRRWPELDYWVEFEDVPHDGLKPTVALSPRQLRSKRNLLFHAVSLRSHCIYRHGQLAELFADLESGRALFPRTIYLDHGGDRLAKRLYKEHGYSFDPSPEAHLPPMFPGDKTSFRTRRAGKE